MNITALYSDRSALSIAQIYGTQATDSESSATTQTNGTGVSACNQADSFDLSKPAELFSKLQQLAETDPEKLKEVCADIAQKLESASEEQSGPEAKMLSELAEKFQNVADGGDVSQLQPPARPQGGPPPAGPQGVADTYSQQDDQSLVSFLNSESSDDSQTSTLNDLLSSFIEEVDKALQ